MFETNGKISLPYSIQSQKLGKGNFSIVAMKEYLIEENFAKSIPILHIRGLRNLKENRDRKKKEKRSFEHRSVL